jgi:protein-tyrosine phosphatase
MKIIDLHTHILPNVDDGSDSLEKTIEHLHTISEAGVEKLFLTPHYMLGKFANSKANVKKEYEKLKDSVEDSLINTQLLLGAEVYCDDTLINQVIEERLTLGDSNYVLFETSLNDTSDNSKKFIYELQMNRFRPILAHPERYSYVHSHPHIVKEFMNRDVLLQVNASSLLGYHGKKVKYIAWNLVYKGYAHFVASDDHCRHSDYILKKAYYKVADKIDERTADLLFYKKPLKVFNNQEIDTFYVEVREESNNKHRRHRPWWKKLLSFTIG